MEDTFYARGVHFSSSEWVAGSILILSAIKFTRRTTGWIIPILIILALTTIVTNPILPAILYFTTVTFFARVRASVLKSL